MTLTIIYEACRISTFQGDASHEDRRPEDREVQRGGRQARVQQARGKRRVGVRADRRELVRGQVEGHLLLSQGLHVRVSDGDRGLRQARAGLRRPRRRGSGRIDRQRVRQARLAARPQGPDEPQPLPVRRYDGLARRPARRARPAGRRCAAGDVHRRPRQRHPARVREQPQRRPQPGRDPAHPGRAADGRAVPVQPDSREGERCDRSSSTP